MAKKKNETLPESQDLFFLTFIGEYVEIVGSFFYQDKEVPISAIGYLLDMDDTWYFLGESPDEIVHAIKKDAVKHIQVTNDDIQLSKMLLDLPTPNKDEGN